MGTFFKTLPILAVLGVTLLVCSAELEVPQVAVEVSEDAKEPSASRVKRQYGMPYEESSQEYSSEESYYDSPTGNNYPFPPMDICPPNNPSLNGRKMRKIHQEVIGNKITENLEKYFLPNFIQHNPHLEDGIEPLRAALSPGGILFGPQEQVDYQHVGADGDLVWIHGKQVKQTGEVFAYVDIFRFECGMIAEHWDVVQSTNILSKNDHTFF